jgi:O-antigen/teichoic acid export membrane protein
MHAQANAGQRLKGLMRTKLSLYNTISAVALQIVNLIVNLILPPVMIKVYGSEVNGLVTSIRQFITYFNLVEAGLAGAAVYALYKPLADKNRDDINGILSASNRFYNISGFIFSALVLVTAFMYPMFTSGQGIDTASIAALVLIIGASGALEFFAVGKYKVLYTADQKSYVISIINAAAVALNAIIILVLASMGYDIVIVQLLALLSFFARSALYIIYGRLKYRELNFKAPPMNEALDKRWDSLILQVLGVASSATPIVVISLMISLKEASVFGVYNMVFTSVLALLTTFSNGLSAIFGDLLVRNELGTLQKAYRQYEYLYYALVAWGYSVAAIMIMPFMKIYTAGFTDTEYIRPVIAALFVAVGVISNIKTPQGMLVISAGLYRETRLQSLIQALIIVVLSVILAPLMGITGVLIASLLSNLYRDIDLIFFIPKTVTKLKPMMTIRRVLRLCLLFTAVVIPALYFVDISAASYVQWALYAMPVGIWALLVITGGNILAERETAREVYERIRLLLGRRAGTGSAAGK